MKNLENAKSHMQETFENLIREINESRCIKYNYEEEEEEYVEMTQKLEILENTKSEALELLEKLEYLSNYKYQWKYYEKKWCNNQTTKK